MHLDFRKKLGGGGIPILGVVTGCKVTGVVRKNCFKFMVQEDDQKGASSPFGA